jgi:hypothetical protein
MNGLLLEFVGTLVAGLPWSFSLADDPSGAKRYDSSDRSATYATIPATVEPRKLRVNLNTTPVRIAA